MKKNRVKIFCVLSIIFSSCMHERGDNRQTFVDANNINSDAISHGFFRTNEEHLKVSEEIYEPFIWKSDSVTLKGFWNRQGNIVYYIPKLFSKECLLRFPIIDISMNMEDYGHVYSADKIFEGACKTFPVLPTKYSVELVGMERIRSDTVYYIIHRVYHVNENVGPTLPNYCSLAVSMKRGLLKLNCKGSSNSFRLPWLY